MNLYLFRLFPVLPRGFKTLVNCVPNASLLVTPILLSPLIIGDNVTPESKCAFLVLLMAVFWTFNPIPLPITSLFPVVLLPLLGLASTETACAAYLKANNMLFLGCLALALAIEKSNLHQRIALKVLLNVSSKFSLILLCFMMTTMCFSMWIVSTATVAMMLPIADEIFNNLFESLDEQKPDPLTLTPPLTPSVPLPVQLTNGKDSLVQLVPNKLEPIKLIAYQKNSHSYNNNNEKLLNNGDLTGKYESWLPNGHQTLTIGEGEQKEKDATPPLTESEKNKICKLFYLCIAYSATIGSVSTLTSNGANLIMKDILENQYENRDPVDYASWIIFAAPASILICFILWFVFANLYFRNISISENRRQVLRQHIAKKYERLGPISFHEWAVLFVFLVMILLYCAYKPQFFPGWSVFFENNLSVAPKPASAAILCVILLFLIPYKPKWNPDFKNEALLDWHTIQTKLEWGVLFIRGGGFSMADAVKSSGLSEMVGTQLSQLGTILPVPVLIMSISVVANFVIEVMRSSATASILFPVAIKLSEGMNLNPLKIVIPLSTSCAYAFISPVGTTTNTIIYYHGNLSIKDMIVPGLIAKTISMTVMMLNTYLLGNMIFGIDNSTPDWLLNYSQSPLNITIEPLDELSLAPYNTTNMIFNTSLH